MRRRAFIARLGDSYSKSDHSEGSGYFANKRRRQC